MVYGKSVTDALTTAGYSFDDFMAAVKAVTGIGKWLVKMGTKP